MNKKKNIKNHTRFKDAAEKNEKLINELEKRDKEIQKLKESEIYNSKNLLKKHSLNSIKSNGRINENEYKSNGLNKDKTISKLSSIDNREKNKSGNDNNDNDSLENFSKFFEHQKHNNNNENKIDQTSNDKGNNFENDDNLNESKDSLESEKEIDKSDYKRRKLSDNNNDNIQIHSFLDT